LCSICEPYLYKDCLVGNVDLFTRGLEPKSRKENLLNKVTTLRLYHPFESPDEPSYSDLLSDGRWAENGKKAKIQGHSDHIRRSFQGKAYADRFWGRNAGDRLRSTITSGNMDFARMSRDCQPECHTNKVALEDEAFANLERVIMTSTGDQTWGDSGLDDFRLPFDAYPETTTHYQLCGIPRKLDPKPVPHFLLGLEGTKHYCQTSLAGPMALKNEIIQVVNPPEIVTFHINNRIMEEGILPPIVVGAVNRYMFGAPSVMMCDFSGDSVGPGQVVEILRPIRNMLNYRNRCLTLYPGTFDHLPLEEIPLYGSTTIELYNYVRHVDIDTINPITKIGPSNLRGIQYQLDRTIGEWKGKVTLKNSEDAPYCSACGQEPDQRYLMMGRKQ
jgi:hypothetical protein